MANDTTVMTGPETAALAPYLDRLHPADFEFILFNGRRMGIADRDRRRRGETDPLYVCARTPDVIDTYRRTTAEAGEMQFRIRFPQNRGAVGGVMADADYAGAAVAYGATFLAATEAMRALYLDDDATADAALAALAAMGAGDAR